MSDIEKAWQFCCKAREFPEPDEGKYWRYQGFQGLNPLQLILDHIERKGE